MSVLLFASSYKSYTSLQNVYIELVKRNVPTFFLYSTATDISYPNLSIEQFSYDTNVETDLVSGFYMESINLYLPFEPKAVLLARERWQPEQSIIWESKQKYSSKVYVIEVSSMIVNNIENRLEMISRDRLFPQSMIDGYFEHSEFLKSRRIDCLYSDWSKKSIVVGNPRFDKLHDIDETKCLEKYEVDKSKTQVLFWGLINTSRKKSLEFLNSIQKKFGNSYQIFYKPNPQEPSNPLFRQQFNPFIVKNVQVIYDDIDINTMSKICDIHISSVSSVCQYSFYFKKKLCTLNEVCNIEFMTNDYSRYLMESKDGVEDSANFWMSVFKLKTKEEFLEFIELDRINVFNKTNALVGQITKENTTVCDNNGIFLEKASQPKAQFIKMFDEFNDGKASERITNYLLNMIG